MDWLTLIFSLITGCFVIYYFFFCKLNKFEKLGILHIKPLPGLGNMAPAVFRVCPLAETVNRTYKLNEDAKYVGFYEYGEPTIIVRSLELIKNITIKHFDHFIDHRDLVDGVQDPLFGNNLVSLRGEKWREMRNLLTPAFTGSKIKAMFKLMSDCGKNFANYLADRATDKPHVIESKDAFTRYTNDVIATCAFGISIDSMRNPNNDFYVLGRKAVKLTTVVAIKIFLVRKFPYFTKFFNIKITDQRVENFFVNLVRETIETRNREGIVRPDMLQLLMETRDNKSGNGPQLTIIDMAAQAFIFFVSGFDSATHMCFVAHELAVNPAIQTKLQEEIDKVLEETNGDVTYDAINEMQYLDAIIAEALRIYPNAIFLNRVCAKAYDLPPALPGAKAVTVQPGDTVLVPVYSLHRDPKYFPDPQTFNPERFIKNGQSNIHPLTYMPFGLGPRMCIGNRFALFETKVLIFHLLAKCYLKPSAKTRVPLELGSFSMTAKGGFWIEIESRNKSSITTKDSLDRSE